MAALACVWISLPRPAFVPLAAGILLTWYWYCAQALQRGSSALRTLELSSGGGARCEEGSGRWFEAEILPGSYVSSWLIVLSLGARGASRRSLMLLPDAADAEELRRLRVWLRWRLTQG